MESNPPNNQQSVLPTFPVQPAFIEFEGMILSSFESERQATGGTLNSQFGLPQISTNCQKLAHQGFLCEQTIPPTIFLYMENNPLGEKCTCHDWIGVISGAHGHSIPNMAELAAKFIKQNNVFCIVTMSEFRRVKSLRTENHRSLVNYQDSIFIQIEHVYGNRKLLADFSRSDDSCTITKFIEQSETRPLIDCLSEMLNDSQIWKQHQVV